MCVFTGNSSKAEQWRQLLDRMASGNALIWRRPGTLVPPLRPASVSQQLAPVGVLADFDLQRGGRNKQPVFFAMPSCPHLHRIAAVKEVAVHVGSGPDPNARPGNSNGRRSVREGREGGNTHAPVGVQHGVVIEDLNSGTIIPPTAAVATNLAGLRLGALLQPRLGPGRQSGQTAVIRLVLNNINCPIG